MLKSSARAQRRSRPPSRVVNRKMVKLLRGDARYSGWTGMDMSQFDPDLPSKHVKTKAGQPMRPVSTMDPDKEWDPPGPSPSSSASGGTGPTIVGSPTTVADELTRWMETKTGIDGLQLAQRREVPGHIADCIELVVPGCGAAGTMWNQYDGLTLREKSLGPGAFRLRDDHPRQRLSRRAVETRTSCPRFLKLPVLLRASHRAVLTRRR